MTGGRWDAAVRAAVRWRWWLTGPSLLVLAVVGGRLARPDGSELALVWPASGIGVAWLALARDARRSWAGAAVIAVVTVAANLATGAPPLLAVVFMVANVGQAVLGAAVLTRGRVLLGGAAADGAALRRAEDLGLLLGAALVSSAWAATVVASGQVLVGTGIWDPVTLAQLLVRNSTSVVTLTGLALVVATADAAGGTAAGRVERWAMTALYAVAFGATFLATTGLPLAFLLLPFGKWWGLRRSTRSTALSTVVVQAGVLAATAAGRGAFGALPVTTGFLVVHCFTIVLTAFSLLVALNRDERRALLREVSAARDEATDQARLLEAVFSSTSDAITVVDRSGTALLRNPAARALRTALRPGDATASATAVPLTDPVTGLPLPPEEHPVHRALDGRRTVARDVVVRGPDGRDLVLEVAAYPIVGDGRAGWVGGAVTACRDVTDERRAAADLRAARDLSQGVLDAATEQSVIGCDADGVITVFNVGAERMLGYSRDEVVGRATPELIHLASEVRARADELGIAPGFEVFVQHTRQHGHEARRWTYVCKDHQRVPVELVVTAMRDADGVITGYIGVATDISARLRAETAEHRQLTLQRKLTEARVREEKAALERKLALAQRMESVGRLAGGVAHDFNNLLAAIMAYSELLAGELRAHLAAGTLPGADDLAAMVGDLAEMTKAGERGASLTRQLLVVSRRDAAHPVVVDLGEAVAGIAGLTGRTLGEDIELRTVLDPAAPRVLVDRGQLDQVCLNLVINARDAMPDGGVLTIATGRRTLTADALPDPGMTPGDVAVLRVSDTGTGMPEDVLAHVFEPFFTTKVTGQGTGLGLSTVYGIVREAGGGITIDSTPGVGTSVTVFLPATAEAPVESGPGAPVVAPSQRRTILLVEDDDGVREPARRILELHGHRVLAAPDAEAALALAGRPDVDLDLLLTDVVMPGRTGRQLAEELLRDHPDLPVLFTTGHSADILDGDLPAGRHLVEKPYTAERLLRAVDTALTALAGVGPDGQPSPTIV